MRFLVDQNVPVGVTTALRTAGHEAEHTRELGLSQADDLTLLTRAQTDGSTVITFDSDFSRLLALSGARAPSVVHLRLGPEHLPDLGERVLRAVAEVEGLLSSGAIIVVEPGRIRSRPLPVE